MRYVTQYESFDKRYHNPYVIRILNNYEELQKLKGSILRPTEQGFTEEELEIIHRIPNLTRVITVTPLNERDYLFYTNSSSSFHVTKYEDEYYTLRGFDRCHKVKGNGFCILIDGKDLFLKLSQIINDTITIIR